MTWSYSHGLGPHSPSLCDFSASTSEGASCLPQADDTSPSKWIFQHGRLAREIAAGSARWTAFDEESDVGPTALATRFVTQLGLAVGRDQTHPADHGVSRRPISLPPCGARLCFRRECNQAECCDSLNCGFAKRVLAAYRQQQGHEAERPRRSGAAEGSQRWIPSADRPVDVQAQDWMMVGLTSLRT